MLGREPQGSFEVVVRDRNGEPVVIRNHPLLRDGTPMPTLYWLVGRPERLAVDRLEASGGVRDAEAGVPPREVAEAHARYAAERDRLLPGDWSGPVPSGGVGGTRQGIKCLHAHYAWYLAGGDDPVGRWVSERLRSSGEGGLAAIDCGTNSTRLLVVDANGRTVERLMRITRLGQGVDRTGQLAPEAVDRTVEVLREYRAVMDRLGVTRVRMAATSAARDAANREQFFAEAREAVGVEPELLRGDDEGALSFAGATAELDPSSGPWLIADIGGGSTELAFGHSAGGRPEEVVSLDVGCVRVTERFLHGDPPAPESISAARAHVAAVLEETSVEYPRLAEADALVGLAGTVACLAAIDQELASYDRSRVHHHLLSRRRVEEMLAALAGDSAAERRQRAGMEEGRVDVIVGGTIVLAELMRHFRFEECLTSEADILDGMVMSLIRG